MRSEVVNRVQKDDVRPFPGALPNCTVVVDTKTYEGVTLTNLRCIGMTLDHTIAPPPTLLVMEGDCEIESSTYIVRFKVHPANMIGLTNGRYLGILVW